MTGTWKATGICAVLALLAGCVSTQSARTGSEADAAKANTRLAAAYLQRGDVDLAMEKVDKALEQDDEFAEAHLVKGMILARAEEYADADRYYLRAERLGRENPDVRNNVAAYLCERGRHDDGERIFLEVARMPTYGRPAIAYTNAGMCAKRAGEPARAERHFRRALELEPNYGAALWHLAELSFAQGEFLAARAFLQRLEGVQRLGPEGLWLGVQVERRLEDAAAARRYADILLRDFPDSKQAELMLQSQSAGDVTND